jgi:hypothetical protein
LIIEEKEGEQETPNVNDWEYEVDPKKSPNILGKSVRRLCPWALLVRRKYERERSVRKRFAGL